MSIFRFYITETPVGFYLQDLTTGEIVSSIEIVNEDDIETEDETYYQSDDETIEYEEITIYRLNRHKRSYDDILSILLDEFLSDSLMFVCAAAA